MYFGGGNILGQNISQKEDEGCNLHRLGRFFGSEIEEMIADDGAHQIENDGHGIVKYIYWQVYAKQGYNRKNGNRDDTDVFVFNDYKHKRCGK